jgi:hypothetical protein
MVDGAELSDKHASDYYSQRLKKQLLTSEMFPEIKRVLIYPDETPATSLVQPNFCEPST